MLKILTFISQNVYIHLSYFGSRDVPNRNVPGVALPFHHSCNDGTSMDAIKRRILSAVSLHHACNDGSVVALPSVFPILYTQTALIQRYSDIGTIILVGLVVAFLFQLLIGHHVRTHHYRRFLALDAVIVGFSLLLLTFSKSYVTLILYFIGVRIGTSIYHPVGIAWISHAFAGKRLDRAMGIQSAFGDIGVLASFIMTGFLAERFNWKLPLLMWSVINFIVLFSALTISRGTSDRPAVLKHERVSWRETFCRLKPFIPLVLFGGISWGITLNYAPSLLNHKLGIPISKTGIILASWMAAGTVSTMFYGRIAEFMGRSRTLVLAYSVIIVSVLLLGISNSTTVTITAFITYGLAIFITYPANLSIVGSIIDAKNRTAAFSLVSNIMIIGNSTFAFLSGFISDAFGIQTPFLVLAGAASIVLAYLSVSLRQGTIPAGAASIELKPEDIVCG